MVTTLPADSTDASIAGSAEHIRRASPDTAITLAARQTGSESKTNRSDDSDDLTMYVMVPDLPLTYPVPQPGNIWTDQLSGSAATVNGVGLAPATADSSLQQLASAGSSGLGGNSNSPGATGNGGGQPPGGHPQEKHSDKGFVLLAGGQGGGKFALAKSELFDPSKQTFSASSPMKFERIEHTATWLSEGKILVTGGEDTGSRAQISAEIFDTAAETFSRTGNMTTARAEHSATLISGCDCPADGKVLITGGATFERGPELKSAELYDPATGAFSPTGSMKTARAHHTATLIASGPLAGNVLIAGGLAEDGSLISSAELYDPSTGQFTATGSMATPRDNQTATWLDPAVVKGNLAGQVLITGGGDGSSALDSAEVYDPDIGTFTTVGNMKTPRTLHGAVLLQSGEVLIAGGQASEASFPTTAELFNPATGVFSATGSTNNVHVGGASTALIDGRALIAGGRSNYADLYDPVAGTFSSTGPMLTDLAESTSTLIR